jgi:ATP-dependent Clp protease adaptor protein ClpS
MKTILKKEVLKKDTNSHGIMVYNDSVNSFEHVTECFIKYCNHTSHQAEQCAFIIHSKGKYIVKTGDIGEIANINTALTDAGINSELIEL